MLEAPLSQLEDESDQSGYAVSALAPPDVMPIPLGDLTLWYHFGPQTETRYLTDETGAVTDTYLYDAYGKTIATTGAFYNPHRYGGKYGYHSNLNAAGFILAGQRWYSPHLRRWISRDPIGYEGDDNLYDYVGQRPTMDVDPSGLAPGDWRFDESDHGGPHFQKGENRYRPNDLSGIKHKGITPPPLSKTARQDLLNSDAYKLFLKRRANIQSLPPNLRPRVWRNCLGVLGFFDIILQVFTGVLQRQLDEVPRFFVCTDHPELCEEY